MALGVWLHVSERHDHEHAHEPMEQVHEHALLALPLFTAYLTRFQIVPEERALATAFGEEFAAYRRRVRRWL